MTDFVIVAAASLAAALATPAANPAEVAASVPLTAPTVGFHAYPDAASCEQATAAQVAPAGRRLVCVPVEPLAGDMANAY